MPTRRYKRQPRLSIRKCGPVREFFGGAELRYIVYNGHVRYMVTVNGKVYGPRIDEYASVRFHDSRDYIRDPEMIDGRVGSLIRFLIAEL